MYKTYTERIIEKKYQWIPIKFLRDKYIEKLLIKNKKIIEEERINPIGQKYRLLPPMVVGTENNEQNNKNRQILEDILNTEYNANTEKILHKYFLNNKSNAIHKALRYFDMYERHFSRFRGKNVNILEIGIQNGGSSKMWKHYFTQGFPNAKVNIYGIDIDPRCKEFEEDGIKIYIGSQEDRDFLKEIKKKIPKIDILIDDGGHTMMQQIVTFEEMYEHIKYDGLYWCEDVGTSYWQEIYMGGYKSQNSFIEYTKNLIDFLNAYNATKYDDLEVNDFTNSAYSITYYENVVVIEKRERNKAYKTIASDAIIGNRTIY